MSDQDLRELARDAEPSDVRLVRAKLRVAQLDRVRFEALAQLDDPWALAALGLRERPSVPEFGDRVGCRERPNYDAASPLARDVRRVRTVSHEAALRACFAVCRWVLVRSPHSTRDPDVADACAWVRRRLAAGPATWGSGWLHEHDRADWSVEIRLSAIGMVLDAWSMLVQGFDGASTWSGARCVMFALAETGINEEVARADVVRELREWALLEVQA